MHPDPEVDLCAFLVGYIAAKVKAEQNKEIFYLAFEDSITPSREQLDELSAVEEVLMVGYPTGVWDAKNNFPIIRRGITASHPAVNFEGKNCFLIDAACFPGSSGSPVLIFNDGGYSSPGGIFTVGSRILLLGTLSSGFYMTAAGEIVVEEIPVSQKPITITRLMIHLGHVIKSGELIALGNEVRRVFGF